MELCWHGGGVRKEPRGGGFLGGGVLTRFTVACVCLCVLCVWRTQVMQPLQRHLLSSDDDKVPAEFIWQSNFPRGDLEQIFFFFLSRAHPAVRRMSGRPCCRRSFGLGRKKKHIGCVVSNPVGRCGGRDFPSLPWTSGPAVEGGGRGGGRRGGGGGGG